MPRGPELQPLYTHHPGLGQTQRMANAVEFHKKLHHHQLGLSYRLDATASCTMMVQAGRKVERGAGW